MGNLSFQILKALILKLSILTTFDLCFPVMGFQNVADESNRRMPPQSSAYMDESIRKLFHNIYGPKKLMCPKCNTYYKHKAHLFLHQELECGKPTPGLGEAFYCPYCDYRSFQKGNLFSHINRKHIRRNSPNIFAKLFQN